MVFFSIFGIYPSISLFKQCLNSLCLKNGTSDANFDEFYYNP